MAERPPQDVAEQNRRSAILGRTSDRDDIAAQVVTFCRADSVTGQVLVIDGRTVFH